MTLVKLRKPTYAYPNVFDELFKDIWGNVNNGSGTASFVPSTNVWEDKAGFNIELSAPGFTKEDIKVEVEENVLSISGEHKTETEKTEKTYSRKEFSFGSFKRSFTLPENINTENINAKYENGILTLVLPKKEVEVSKATKQITIS